MCDIDTAGATPESSAQSGAVSPEPSGSLGEPSCTPSAPTEASSGGSAGPSPDGCDGLAEAAGRPGAAASPAAPAAAGAAKGAQLLKTVRINLAACKYSVLRVVTRKLGWAEVGDDSPWEICWTDTSSGTDRLMRLRRPQKLNHFPGMLEIARKKSLARNLTHMAAAFPQHYNFHPKTFLLPEMLEPFLAEFGRGRGAKTFIMKLDNGSQGRGIKLVQSTAAATAAIPTFEHPNIVASQYIANPFLINGFKFDLRIYVLVRSCDPLRVFIHNEGLARFCTERYEPPCAGNLANPYTHLTNYAVNKHNPSFVFNKDAAQGGAGSKWSISSLAEWMAAAGHDWGAVWGSIQHMIAKSLVAIQPILQYHYRSAAKPDDDGFSCFEVLGYDVLLDESLRPWLLEVNHSPSFTTDTPLDLAIKERLINETMHLVGISVERVREELAAREAAKLQRLYHSPAVQQQQPSVHAQPGLGGAGRPASPGPHPSPAAGRQQQQQQQQRSPYAHLQAEQQGTAGPAEQKVAGNDDAGSSGGQEAAGAGRSGCGAGAWGGVSAEWEARQRAHEEAHMGLFQRILPSDDPEKQALYEELQAGAQQVFFKQTMQGRLQHTLIQIKEKRQAEEAEVAAREAAHRQRVESLKAWMANVCVKTREQRRREAERAAAEEEGRLLALALGGEASDGGDGVGGGGVAEAGGGERLGAQQGEAAGAGAEGLEWAEREWEELPTCGAAYPNPSCTCPPRPSLHRTDTACTSGSGGSQGTGEGACGSGSCGCGAGHRCACSQAAPLNIRGLPCGGHSCGSSPVSPKAAGVAPAQPPIKYAWRNKPPYKSPGAELAAAPAPAPPPVPYSPGMGSGRFMRRIASTLCPGQRSPPGGQQQQQQGCGDACGWSSGGSSLDGGCDSAAEWREGGAARQGRPPAELSPPAALCGLGLEDNQMGTYIPPAMLSALHSVSLGAQLLGGPRPPPPPPPGAGAPPAQLAQPLCGYARARALSPAAPPAACPQSPSGFGPGVPRGTGSSGHSTRQTRSPSCGLAPVAARGRGWAHPPSSAERPSPQPGAPALQRQAAAAAAAAAVPPPALPRRGSLAGSTAALQRQYMREIEKQAVKSIADMIAEVLGK